MLSPPPAAAAPAPPPAPTRSGSSGSSFLDDIELPVGNAPASDSEWKDLDDWEEPEGNLGVVPGTSSQSSTHSPQAASGAASGPAAGPETAPSVMHGEEAAPQPPVAIAPAEQPHGEQPRLQAEAPIAPFQTQTDSSPAAADRAQAQPAAVARPTRASAPIAAGEAAPGVLQPSVPATKQQQPPPQQSAEISAAPEEEQPAPAVQRPAVAPPATAPEPSSAARVAPAPAPAAASGGAWGWGASAWGLQALGGKLQQVAAGTVKELQSSLVELQQALAEVEDEPEEGGQAREEGQGPEADRRLPASTSASAGAVGPSGAGSGARSEAGGAEGAAALAAGRQGGGAQEEEVEEELEEGHGLKVMDEQMEQLTAGAAKAFTSLGSLLTGVAKGGWSVGQVIASKVEAATKEMSAGVSGDMHELQQAAKSGFRGAAGSVSKIGSTLEKGLETVSRTALELLLEDGGHPAAVASQGRLAALPEGGGSQQAAAAAAAEEAEGEPKSFEGLFALFGGRALRDELQRLSNECARTCNRSRAKLERGQQQQLDALLAQLGQVFAGPLQASEAAPEAGPGEGEEALTVAACWEQLQSKYRPVESVVEGLIAKGPVAGTAGVQRLAELATAQVQVLLDLGVSLSGPARGVAAEAGEGSEAGARGLEWPGAPAAQAALLRRMGGRMAGDVQRVAVALAGSGEGQQGVGAGTEAEGGEEVEEGGKQGASSSVELAAAVAAELATAAAGASEQLHDSYRDLLYCVLVRSLVTDVAVQ